MKGVAVQKASDLFQRQLIVGGAGAASGFSQTPILLSRLLGMKFKLTEGYAGAQAAMLAMERGEIEGLCNTLSGFRGVRPGWIEEGQLIPLFTMYGTPNPASTFQRSRIHQNRRAAGNHCHIHDEPGVRQTRRGPSRHSA